MLKLEVMKRTTAILLFYSLLSTAAYAESWLERFDFTPKKSLQYRAKSIDLPEVFYESSDVESYNRAVALHNDAIDLMEQGDSKKAIELFKEAIELSPSTTGFRSNYLIALSQNKNLSQTLLEEGNTLLAMEPNNHRTAYIMGITYLNNLKQYETAANYFSYALNYDPENSNYASALIKALESSEKYNDSVFQLLEKYSSKINEAYHYYLLGLKYLDRNNYTKALKVLAAAKKLDANGYTHHTYVRAGFYSGHLKGLEETTKATLKKFPSDINQSSTKRIYNALASSDYSMTERITLSISGASALETLNFHIRPIDNFHKHQYVQLLSSEIISKGKSLPLTPQKNSDKSITLSIPKQMWGPKLTLELKYRIKTQALNGVYFPAERKPDISSIKIDEKFSIDDGRLTKLVNYVDKLELEDLVNINNHEEKFVIKAATAVAQGLKYRENAVDMPVSWVFDNPDSCDCTEYSRLLAAMCLKKGIAARLVNGFLVKSENMDKETSIGHAWCEVYINNKGWMPIDPTLQVSMHRAYLGNLLSDQIFFEYLNQHENTRIGIDYTARNSDIPVALENTYIISKWKN